MLITLYTFPYPPNTVGPFNGQGLPQSYGSGGVIRNYNGVEVPPFYTNGAGLVSEQGLDPRLRNLLMRCLAVVPSHRPGLEELQAWALDAETNPDFFSGVGGDLTTTELADRYICRPRDVSTFFEPTCFVRVWLTKICDISPHQPRYRCRTRSLWRRRETRRERRRQTCGSLIGLSRLVSELWVENNGATLRGWIQ